MMSQQQLEQEEEALRQQIRQLSASQRQCYYEREKQEIKDPDTFAALNYFFVAGLHHLYLGKTAHGIANLVLMTIGLIFFSIGGWLLVAAVIVIELPQLFWSQRIVHQYNNQVMRKILNDLQQNR